MTPREEWLPFCLPDVSDAEVAEMTEAVRSGWWAKGPRTMAFEKAFCEYTGAKYAVAVNSCTAALHLALLAKDIGEGDEVITSPLTFTSTANTVLHVGARPVFADIDPDTGCIDPLAVERAITPRTKAIVPVHYSGMACDMDALRSIAKAHNLFLSEDAAHAVETRHNGELIGHSGTASFSFYATKNLATGEGGMLTTDDPEIERRARIMSCHGMSSNAWNRYGKGGAWGYDIEEAGYKYNMFDLQAALGLVQLRRMDDMQRRRMEIVKIYDDAFAGMEQLRLQKIPEYCHHSRHLYVMRIRPETLTIDRDAFIEELKARNIGVSVHFLPVHLMSLYTKRYGHKPGDYPQAEEFSGTEITLPLYSTLTHKDAQDVVSAVQDVVKKHAK